MLSPKKIQKLALTVVLTAALTSFNAPSQATAHLAAATPKARAGNVATPGNFTGYGFDQCLAPTQAAMDAWLTSSPFWAVGIYISGYSRACRSQPNLTPQWITTQLENGWRLLPITLGPQASCADRFPRYGSDATINPRAANKYAAARAMGRKEATSAVAAAQALGIVAGSTLWYDLEHFVGDTACRKSAMWFLSAWTKGMHAEGYVSGVYSSASSGISALDDLRVDPPTGWAQPDRIWIADWNGEDDVKSTYIRPDGWMPRDRMHQYEGGHNETWGGVTINIDRNYLDLGQGSVARPGPNRCDGTRINFATYKNLRAGDEGAQVTALQCLLRRQGFYVGNLDGVMGASTVEAVSTLRRERGLPMRAVATSKVWISLHANGLTRLLKFGSANEPVRRLQRSLNAAADESLKITGTFEEATTAAVKRYQSRNGLATTGVVTSRLWGLLQSGKL